MVNRYRVSLWDDEKVLERDSGVIDDGCRTWNVVSATDTLKNG